MRILLFDPEPGEKCKMLVEGIEPLVPANDLEVYHTVAAFSRRLQQPTYTVGICILWIPTRSRLSEILPLQHLLEDLPIFLVLPDKRKDTISKGYSLSPRLTSSVDENLSFMIAVIEKKLSSYRDFNMENGYQMFQT